MLQIEFENRVKMNVTAEEFEAINEVYMNSDLDKDEFCKVWAKMNASRVAAAKAERKAAEEKAEKIRKAFNLYKRIENINAPERLFSPAGQTLSVRDQRFVESLGIDFTGYTCYGIPFAKSLCDIEFEVGKYCKVI